MADNMHNVKFPRKHENIPFIESNEFNHCCFFFLGGGGSPIIKFNYSELKLTVKEQ